MSVTLKNTSSAPASSKTMRGDPAELPVGDMRYDPAAGCPSDLAGGSYEDRAQGMTTTRSLPSAKSVFKR